VLDLPIEDERELMKRGIARLEETFDTTPRGNRSPPFALGPNTADLLEEFGFAYDSSLFGHDEPYRPRVPITDGGLRDFVELPVSWELDDAPYFLFNFFPYMSGLATPAQVLEIWKAEFDGSYQAGGCFLLVVHPFCIGRHPRIAMLDQLIEYIKSFPDVWFGTHLEVAEEWRRGQVEQGSWDTPDVVALS
jgi:peptidoglycan/xylan/chitin deacetylase (PgdA/CDA1 family)